MIHRNSEMQTEIRSNLKGGRGDLSFRYPFTKEEMGNRADMLAVATLQPGESIGEHAHVGNGEVYYILTGSAMVTEDGQTVELFPGDAEFCADGHTHAIVNHTSEPMTFLALILRDC